MTSLSSLLQPDRGEPAHSLHLVDAKAFDAWLKGQPERVAALIEAQRFTGKGYELAILPGNKADEWSAIVGVANMEELSPWCLAKAAERLPEGTYRLAEVQPGPAALGWMLAQYRFERYRKNSDAEGQRVLLTTEAAQIDETVRLAEAVALVRDLVNTPAADLGPAELAAAIEEATSAFRPQLTVHQGEALARHFPCVAAVGRAAAPGREPRVAELLWGDESHPRVALIGKGVCFDSGGLDIKPSAAMLWMKKDMGGAAHALALARLVMAANLPVRLHLVIPIVENAVGGDAFRPGDVLTTRAGVSVEIGNTDAEGRLILADALALAGEGNSQIIIDYATLTGAARVALGPELPALFSNDDALADDLLAAGTAVADPLWRLPLWPGYADMLKSEIADINNAGEGGMAGAVTAALFLQKFVADSIPWAHLDTFAWMPAAKPGRPKGGEALGLRAGWAMLKRRYGNASAP